MSKLTIDFSGSLEINADEARFVKYAESPVFINGEEYLKLSSEEQDEFVLFSLGETICEANDVEYYDINIFESRT